MKFLAVLFIVLTSTSVYAGNMCLSECLKAGAKDYYCAERCEAKDRTPASSVPALKLEKFSNYCIDRCTSYGHSENICKLDCEK